jgi:hypothetical protein
LISEEIHKEAIGKWSDQSEQAVSRSHRSAFVSLGIEQREIHLNSHERDSPWVHEDILPILLSAKERIQP